MNHHLQACLETLPQRSRVYSIVDIITTTGINQALGAIMEK
jgi:hypothetical protein